MPPAVDVAWAQAFAREALGARHYVPGPWIPIFAEDRLLYRQPLLAIDPATRMALPMASAVIAWGPAAGVPREAQP